MSKTTKTATRPAKAYKNGFRVSYWWRCETFPKGIPPELAEALDETAQTRVAEMMAQGYQSGELVDWVRIQVDGTEPPEDGYECRGWWDVTQGATP